jgi:hypothetical protein
MLQNQLSRLWQDYICVCPDAHRIRTFLAARGETIINDHIAFRTWGVPGFDINTIADSFIPLGYTPGEAYQFDQKKLIARHFNPPSPQLPRVFVSQLDLDRFDNKFADLVRSLSAQVPAAAADQWDFCTAGRLWEVSYSHYEALRKSSEYAAWLAAFGLVANHFTVSVNGLQTFENISNLCAALQDAGFLLNTDGGLIKGSPQVFLEQASTLAGEVEVSFSDGSQVIPGCYYEFALRYPTLDGQIFGGFVAGSADRIFTSTNRR